jgi:hypothetical protein
MPATESTWRDTRLLHHVFAVTGALLTISTVWMLWKDHARTWKSYQVDVNNIDLKMNELRQVQYETGDALIAHEQAAAALAAAKAQTLDDALLSKFKSLSQDLNKVLTKWRDAGYEYSTVSVDPGYIDQTAEEHSALAADARQKRTAAVAANQAAETAASAPQPDAEKRKAADDLASQTERSAAEAEQKAGERYDELIAYLRSIVDQGKIREDKALGFRKFQAADIDAAKAQLDIAVRDSLGEEEVARRQKIVDELVSGRNENDRESFARLNEVYQSISAVKKDLDRTFKQMTAPVENAQKNFDDSRAELERLRKQHEDRKETFFDFYGGWPFVLGKRILTLPILDAFSSPRKIDNLWSEGLTQDYNFSRVRRYDRCTTCHQSLAKTLPGQPTTAAYVRQELLEMIVVPPSKERGAQIAAAIAEAEQAPEKMVVIPASEGQPRQVVVRDRHGKPDLLANWLGLRLADEGLLLRDDLTVALVLPKTPAAKGVITSKLPPTTSDTGQELRKQTAQLVSMPGSEENLYPTLPGLMVGDVIDGINGQPLSTSGGGRNPQRIAAMLVVLAEEGKPIHLTIKRGLPNPYISHPRLDLYVADASPHRMQLFACTICHEGQGSATDFKWASHTPSTTLDMQRWIEEHGWFDNPHWIYPMYSKRFAQASCLKCHHEVVELEASERYPDAPAPKVTHGYHLVRKYGCYGCHDINGFDGPNRRVGPDLRSEPNYFAVAQQVQAELAAAERRSGAQGASVSPEQLQSWKDALISLTERVASHPEDSQARNQLRMTIEERVAAAGEQASLLDKSLANLANMLRDIETPGALRRAGPSLRFVNSKLDPAFLYDWIANPQHFRPTTRMPRFFGLWDHLKDEHGKVADERGPQLEPIEILGTVAYLRSYAENQVFEPEQRPTDIDQWTDEEKIARGKIQFQTRGCLACHDHKDFAEIKAYRSPDEIVQGPDLSAVGDKFSRDRNPAGPDWLYSWIKNPTKYHVRTMMPNVFLDPERDPGANVNDPGDDKWFDPADDIVAYLLSASRGEWRPAAPASAASGTLDAASEQALKRLTLEHLNEAFYRDAAEQYYMTGIPPELESELKGAEKDLILPAGQSLSNQQRLKYIGRKTIAKYGCFGCHDIPGFEDAKPIGTGLADWGRKDPARLAFLHITHYVSGHGHGHAGAAPQNAAAPHGGDISRGASAATAKVAVKKPMSDADHEEMADFYTHALEARNRIGFIYQKLKEPRSYDFEKTENYRYNERLRMPQFPFTAHEREAIITFVIGLVADPPQTKFVFQAKDRNAALIAGRQVLEKYNCGGCHILGLEKWHVSYNPGDFGQRAEPPLYPFLKTHFSAQQLAAAAVPDQRNELHAALTGLLPTDKADGYPIVLDPDNLTLDPSSPYSRSELKYALDLMAPTIVDGSPYFTGQAPVTVPAARIDARYPTWGGVLSKYLLPVVTGLERRVNPNASGAEAYGWLPPPLAGEGNKVQTAWLHDFLLDPHPIRPAVFLRMPKFNMSSGEATALANYFAAADSAEYPYTYASGRDRSRLAALEAEYQNKRQVAGNGGQRSEVGGQRSEVQSRSEEAPPGMQRLDDAMKIVVNGNFCVKCHTVADFNPAGSERAKAPNLAEVYRRLRPDFVRKWIANPKMILPYTSMPVNIPFQDPPPILGQLYHGTNVEQIDALTDLLMNYDQYARQSTRIADRVVPAPMEATPPATTGSTGSSN